MDNTVLVLGARGRLGGAVAQAFAAAGWRVLAQRRSGGKAPADAGGHRMGAGPKPRTPQRCCAPLPARGWWCTR